MAAPEDEEDEEVDDEDLEGVAIKGAIEDDDDLLDEDYDDIEEEDEYADDEDLIEVFDEEGNLVGRYNIAEFEQLRSR